MRQFRRLFGCVALTAIPLAACSVINSFDDVVPAKGAGGDTAGGGGSGGAMPTGGTNPGGGDAGDAAGAPPVLPIKGLLAVAGTDPSVGDANVVSLIDPTTGTELARQTIAGAAVTGLAYDGAEGKDVFFEFTGASFPAAKTSVSALQVYAFDDASSAWKTVSTKALPGLPPPRAETFVVLNDRLAYLSYSIVANAPVDSLTVLDTTDPKTVTQVKFTPLNFGAMTEVLGMVGTRGVLGDPTATGGTLAVVIGSGCTGEKVLRGCAQVHVLPVTVGEDVSQGVAVDLAPSLVGQPAFTSAQLGQLGYVAFTPAPGQSVRLRHFDPRNLAELESGTPAFKSPWLGGLAYAECQDVALFTGAGQGSLFSASPAGLTAEVALGHPGQSVVYEPFTRRAVTLYNPANVAFDGAAEPGGEGGAGGASDLPALDSFDVKANAALTKAEWTPPTNLAPNLAVARFPLSYDCSQ